MASVDSQSVRKEVKRIKAEFETLKNTSSVSSEISLLVGSLLTILEVVMAIFLERKTKKTSKNSSIPSSQTQKDETTPPKTGTNNKGHNENRKSAKNTRAVEKITIATVDTCGCCGEDLSNTTVIKYERRTKIDILFEKTIEHVDAQVKECPTCQSSTKADFPNDLHGPLQYGEGLKAFVINLVVAQMVSLARVQKLVNAMMGSLLSESTILKFVLRLHLSLQVWEEQAIEQILKSPVIHVDETGFRVNKKNHWIHVYASGGLTIKLLHRKRGLAAIEEFNIIPRYGGVIIHDCWASYLSYNHCKHGLCGSHLLRELTFIVESNHYAWAKNMKRLLQETCYKVSLSDDKKLNPVEFKNLGKRYKNILTRGEKEMPVIPPKEKGKRGRMSKSDAHNLWERFKKYEAAILLFAQESNVPFTNNRAERDLRMAKVKKKVSGCFRTESYAHAYCRISSYLQTMASQGYNPLLAIQMALAGNIPSDRGE
jgi:transposase-like protein